MTSPRRQRAQRAPSWYGDQIARAKQTVERWNASYPVGSVVDVLSDDGDEVILSFRTTGAAQEMAGLPSLFCSVVGWVPLRRIRVVTTSHGREAQARNDLAARAHPSKPDRRAMVCVDERAEVGHEAAVGDGSGPCASVAQRSEQRSFKPTAAGSSPAEGTTEEVQQQTATSIRVLISLLFSGGSLPTHRLAERCNLTTKRCGQALSVLHDAGLVENPKHGHWRAKRLVVALHRELVSVVAAQVEARYARHGR